MIVLVDNQDSEENYCYLQKEGDFIGGGGGGIKLSTRASSIGMSMVS